MVGYKAGVCAPSACLFKVTHTSTWTSGPLSLKRGLTTPSAGEMWGCALSGRYGDCPSGSAGRLTLLGVALRSQGCGAQSTERKPQADRGSALSTGEELFLQRQSVVAQLPRSARRAKPALLRVGSSGQPRRAKENPKASCVCPVGCSPSRPSLLGLRKQHV